MKLTSREILSSHVYTSLICLNKKLKGKNSVGRLMQENLVYLKRD